MFKFQIQLNLLALTLHHNPFLMNIIVFDTEARKNLFPLTLTRSVADIRMGILTIKERWEKMLGVEAFVLTEAYLQPSYQTAPAGEYIFIDSTVIPNLSLIQSIKNNALIC